MNFNDIKDRIRAALADVFGKKKTAVETGDDIYELTPVERSESADFLRSLNDLTPDDIAPAPEKKKMSASELIGEIIRKTITVACVGVFLWSGGTLVRSFVDYKRGDDLYSSIADNMFEGTLGGGHAVAMALQSRQSTPTADYYTGISSDGSELEEEYGTGSYNAGFERMKANIQYLQTTNPDVYGYIYVPDTKIQLPIVQGEDNDYYLDHAYTNEYMACGSIFADYRAYKNMEYNRNTVLYGHNMNNGTMFADLCEYESEDFYQEHKIIRFDTLSCFGAYEIVAVFKPVAYSEQGFKYYHFTRAESAEDFDDYIAQCKALSLYDTGVTAEYGDRLITLSTCEYSRKNGRMVVVAKRIAAPSAEVGSDA